jgi:regulator of sirC expression with transglutaminase-like and TPR domain
VQLARSDSPEFTRLLTGALDVDLARVALEIAADRYDDLNPTEAYQTLRAYGARVVGALPREADTQRVLEGVNRVLFSEEGFHGDQQSYYDPRNSYLNDVLRRKTGIPISLSVLYVAVAREAGLVLDGVNLPGHFVLRTRTARPVFVDPFHQGELLEVTGCEELVSRLAGRRIALSEKHLAPATAHAVVSRMLRNLKAIYLVSDAYAEALGVLRRLLLLHPEDPIEARDLGIACLHTQRPRQALCQLQTYLSTVPHAPDAQVIGALIAEAHRRVRMMN